MKRIIGVIMLVLVFATIFAITAFQHSFYFAMGVFLLAAFIVLFIWIAIKLII